MRLPFRHAGLSASIIPEMEQHSKPPFELTEGDIRKIFRHPPRWLVVIKKTWRSARFLGNFILVFGIFFVVLNLPAYYRRALYLFTPKPAPTLQLPDREQILKQIELNETLTPPKNNPAELVAPTNLEPNRIVIPKLELDAPIGWDVPVEQMLERLRDGVTHYAGSAKPGEIGNIFVTGHSSNFWWDKGRFNQVFALLDKLAPNDDIFVSYEGKTYHFVVTRSYIVKPTNIEVLNPSDEPILTLMTCTPVGTTINRLIVQAKQVTANSESANQVAKPTLPTALPAIR